MSVENIEEVFSKKTSDVHLVSARYGGKVTGMIAASAMRVSHAKVVVSVRKDGLTQQYIEKGNAFAISLLRYDQLDLVKRFAFYTGEEGEKFNGIPYLTRATGSPIIADSVGYLDCRVLDKMDCGDHMLFLGEVVDAGVLRGGEPLRSSDLDGSQEYQRWRLEWHEAIERN